MISWFEIPAHNLDRAIGFYSQVLDRQVQKHPEFPGFMAFFGGKDMTVGGSIVQHDDYSPATSGVLVYFKAGENLQETLDRVEPNGGKVLKEKSLISEEIGYMALFLDTEGNRIALHSPK